MSLNEITTSRSLRLFVWPNALSGYVSGVAFALAYDVDEARSLILAAALRDRPYCSYIGDPRGAAIDDLSEIPDVYDSLFGFARWGQP